MYLEIGSPVLLTSMLTVAACNPAATTKKRILARRFIGPHSIRVPDYAGVEAAMAPRRRIDMALNIRSKTTHRMAAEPAKPRGVTAAQTAADTARHDLERESSGAASQTPAEELLAIGQKCSSHISRPLRSEDHAELLYDEMGLPREDRS
jgi:hypothetical protein